MLVWLLFINVVTHLAQVLRCLQSGFIDDASEMLGKRTLVILGARRR